MNWDKVASAAFQQKLKKAHYSTKRGSRHYSLWRWKCLERDLRRCVLCRSEENVEVHHIVRWVDNPILRYKKYNGASLCKECHRKGHGGRGLVFSPGMTYGIIVNLKRNGQSFRGASIFKAYIVQAGVAF